MTVYELEADINLLHLMPSKEIDVEDLVKLRMTSATWDEDRSVDVKVIEWDGPSSFVYSDFAYFEHLSPLCLSPAAQSALASCLENRGYFVDTDFYHGEEPYRLFFPTRRISALDLERSVFTKFDDGSVWKVYSHELYPDKLEGEVIMNFEHRLGRIFVSDDFVNTVQRYGLIGHQLTEVWSSQGGAVDLRTRPLRPGMSPRQERAYRKRLQADARAVLAARALP